jgi:sugar phosphate isomerase/epimerase
MTVLGTPYRLGTTSYVLPDEVVPNVRRLGDLVDDVELVLFEVPGYSNLPDAATVAELRALAQTHDLSYTVHLPEDLALARPSSLEKAEKVIACTLELVPWAYVLHLDGREVEGECDSALLARWRDDALRLLEAVTAMVGDAQRLCVENLENYPPECFLPLLDQVPLSLCVDVGHLWLTGRDPLAYLDARLSRTRVVHLHGVGEYDHLSLLHQGAEQLVPILDLLSVCDYGGVLTLEVFDWDDFLSSRTLVAEVVHGIH